MYEIMLKIQMDPFHSVMIVTIDGLAWSVVGVLRNLTKFITKWHVNLICFRKCLRGLFLNVISHEALLLL